MMPDWWSVGIIIFEMMNLMNPFKLPEIENIDNLNTKEWKKKNNQINNDRIINQPIEMDYNAKQRYSIEL